MRTRMMSTEDVITRSEIVALAQRVGPHKAAKALGLDRATVLSVLAGQTVRAASFALARERMRQGLTL